MSVHEVIYDEEGRYIKSQCLGGETLPYPRHLSEEKLGHFSLRSTAYRIRTLTAINPDIVSETETFTRERDKVIVSQKIETKYYYRDQINGANLKTEGGSGFVWRREGESVDIYIAPPKTTIKSRVRGIIRI